MEARSLTEVNQIANLPPLYPEGPNKFGSLVLYIARVPKSNDIILSPLEPQERNVTSVDVNSALYIVQLCKPGTQPVRDDMAYRSSEDSALSPMKIRRKPLPDSARPLTPDSLPSASRMHQPLGASDATISSKSAPILESDQGASISVPDIPERTTSGLHTGMPTRKPLGSRPFLEMSTETSAGPQEGTEDAPRRLVNPTSVPPLDTNIGNQPHPSRPQPISQPHSRSPTPPKPSTASMCAPLTLRLIRRNPSTDETWEVGYIRLQPPEPPSGDADTAPTSTTGAGQHAPIDIEITQSGYARLREQHVRTCSPVESGCLEATAAPRTSGSPDYQNSTHRDNDAFYRQLTMAHSNTLLTTVMGKTDRVIQSVKRPRSDSAASIASNKSDTPTRPYITPTSGSPPEGMKARGYTFLSPWKRQCYFTTGVGGNSLQCFHTPGLPITSTHNNPLVKNGPPRPRDSLVSEMIYNLGSKGTMAKLGSWLNELTHKDARFDFGHEPCYTKVGAERAGGGRNGRQAKLGKITIHEDGFKMLDLLVAAHIGVWWKTWEKYNPVGVTGAF